MFDQFADHMDTMKREALRQYETDLAKQLFIMFLKQGDTDEAAARKAFRGAAEFVDQYKIHNEIV